MHDFTLVCNIAGEMQKMATESVLTIVSSWESCNIKVCVF